MINKTQCDKVIQILEFGSKFDEINKLNAM